MANDLMSIIKKRRSVRDYEPKKVSKELLMELIEAAIWAPTGSNIQPWYYIIVKNEGVLEKIKAFSPGLLGDPVNLIVVCTDRKRAFERASILGRDELCLMDISMAAQNIMLLATEKGLGTCAVRSFNKNAVSKILKLPEHISPDLIVSVGYFNKTINTPKRKSVKEVSFFDRWEGGEQ
jgi:nitroreductase